MKDEREQVLDQFRAVVHMANAIAEIHTQQALAFSELERPPLTVAGPRSAALMETLGNVLNGMDAVTDDDKWLEPIFKEAQRRYPSE